MEAGGLELSEESQDVYRGTNIGLPLLRPRHRAAALLRRHLQPLGRLEPRARPRATSSRKSCSRSAAGRSAGSTSTPTAPARRRHPRPPLRDRGAGPAVPPEAYDFRRFQFRCSPPTRFAEKYGAEIEASPKSGSSQRQPRRPPPRRRPRHRRRRGLPQLRPGRPRLHRQGPRLRPLHRRHRECPAAAQLHQPDPRRHRQPHRPGRPLLLRPPALLPRRGALRASGARWTRQLLSPRPTRFARAEDARPRHPFHRRPRRQISLLTELARSAECTCPFAATPRPRRWWAEAGRCDLGGLIESAAASQPAATPGRWPPPRCPGAEPRQPGQPRRRAATRSGCAGPG